MVSDSDDGVGSMCYLLGESWWVSVVLMLNSIGLLFVSMYIGVLWCVSSFDRLNGDGYVLCVVCSCVGSMLSCCFVLIMCVVLSSVCCVWCLSFV